jgi:NADPH:quinone reductase-like Zn-dependent oxidoreductase
MRAIVQDSYGPVDNLRLVEREPPEPSDGEVLIRVRAAGVDPGVWHTVTGQPYFARLMGIGFFRPKKKVAGWDAAGVVEQVGKAVTRFKVGDEVFGNCDLGGSGTFAEFACLPESRCARKPSKLTVEQAAGLTISGCTALQALRDVAKVTSGMKVLVLGAAGGVGHFAVQIAKSFGASVTGVCGATKAELVRSLGADEIIDYARDGLGDRSRWDAIVDTAGRRSLFDLRRLLTPNGRLAIVGGDGGNSWTGGFPERALAAAALSLFSRRKLAMVDVKVTEPDLRALTEMVQAGTLTTALDRRYPLDQAVEALKDLEKGHARGKSVVVV